MHRRRVATRLLYTASPLEHVDRPIAMLPHTPLIPLALADPASLSLLGLLGGTLALPTSEWLTDSKATRRPDFMAALKCRSFKKMHINHSFTHFDLKLRLRTIEKPPSTLPEGYFWATEKDIDEQGFPTVFKKAVTIFLK